MISMQAMTRTAVSHPRRIGASGPAALLGAIIAVGCTNVLGIERTERGQRPCDAGAPGCLASCDDAGTCDVTDGGHGSLDAEAGPDSEPECAPGEARCAGEVLERCEQGAFREQETCANGCGDGECTRACEPGTGRCTGDVREQCSPAGGFEPIETCRGLCIADACAPCEANTQRCMGEEVQACAEGEFNFLADCGFDCTTGCGGYPVGEWVVADTCMHLAPDALFESEPEECGRFVVTTRAKWRGSGSIVIGADLRASPLQLSLEQQTKTPKACVPGLECATVGELLNQGGSSDSISCVDNGAYCDCTSNTGLLHDPNQDVASRRFCVVDGDEMRLQVGKPGQIVDLRRRTTATYLKASLPQAEAGFGVALALDNDTLVVGAAWEDAGAGAVYVFTSDGQGWQEQARLTGSQRAPDDFFGHGVAISGDTIVVGAPGSVEEPSNPGRAYVFVRAGSTWSEQALLRPEQADTGDSFGFEVAISVDTLVVGAPDEDSNARGIDGNGADNSLESSGGAFVFTRSAGSWTQQAYVKASNTGANDLFGMEVGIDGDLLVVGAPGEDSAAVGVGGDGQDNSALDRGAAYLFARGPQGWVEVAYLKPRRSSSQSRFGTTGAVAINGNTVVIGAPAENGPGPNTPEEVGSEGYRSSGAAYVFVRTDAGVVEEARLKASVPAPGDEFGRSVAVYGDVVLVGSRRLEPEAAVTSDTIEAQVRDKGGAAYLFYREAGRWTQQRYFQPDNLDAGDNFSTGLDISGARIAIGAPAEDSAGSGAGGSGAGAGLQDAGSGEGAGRGDNSLTNSGAVYVYR